MGIQGERLGKGATYARAAQSADDGLGLRLIDSFAAVSDPAELVCEVVARAVLETRSDRGVLSWVDGDEMIVAGCHDPFGEPVPVGSRWPLQPDQLVAVALAGGRVETGSYQDVPLTGLSPALAETYRGLHNLLIAPLRVAGQAIAVLCVSRRRVEAYTAAESTALETVARAAAPGLQGVRLGLQLHDALTELSQLAQRTASVERVKTDVLRLASHELRTPLTVLNGYLSLVQGGFFGEIPEPLVGVMSILQRRTAEMNSLVNDMLVAARVEDVPEVVDGEVVDLGEVLRRAVRDLLPRASESHSLLVEAPAQPVPARLDQERVSLALRNIIDNAIKYSPGGGEVRCRLRAESGMAHIRISDRGLGIAPEDRDKLFTRFGRVLTAANSHIPGIGLGLYFSREVARRHGGDLVLVDIEGGGSVFEMTLPTTAASELRRGGAPAPIES